MPHLKTNSKEFRQKMEGYILSCIDTEAYEKTFQTDKEKLNFVYNCFLSEFWYDNNRLRYKGNEIIGFSEYLKGLPSVITIDFENYRILELAKDFNSYKDTTGMTAKQIEKYEDRILENWFLLVAKNFFRLLAK